jgi:transposase
MSRHQKYPVTLSDSARHELERFVACGKKSAREITRARILLLANEGQPDCAIGAVLGVSRPTIHRLRKQLAEGTYEQIVDVLSDAPRCGRPLKVDSRVEAHITLLACADPPEGAAKWTLRLIADRLVQLELIESISHERVRTALKKTS